MSVGTVSKEGPSGHALGGCTSVGGNKCTPLALLGRDMHVWLMQCVSNKRLLVHGVVQVDLLLGVKVVGLWDLRGDDWRGRQGVRESLVYNVLWWSRGVDGGMWRTMARVKSVDSNRRKSAIDTSN